MHLAELLEARKVLLTRHWTARRCHPRRKRRGHGWMAGYADIGWSNSLGWYEGLGS